MEKDLVTVVIPAYNHEKYVKDSILSVINQTYQNIELIIIDDGSKDNTWQIIQEMKAECEKRFVRVVMKSRENKGVCATLKEMLDLAEGKYWISSASDDMFETNAIKELYDFLSEHEEYTLVVGDDSFIDENGKKIYWDKSTKAVYAEKEAVYKTLAEFIRKHKKYVDFNSENFGSYETLIRGNYLPNGALVRMESIKKVGSWQENLLEDWYMNLQLAKLGKFKFIDKPLFKYRWHSTNTVKDSLKMKEIEARTFEYEKKLVEKSDNLVLKSIMAKHLKRINAKNGFLRRNFRNLKFKLKEIIGGIKNGRKV